MGTATAYVEEAKQWADELVRTEARFPGDYGPAMRRVADKSGLPFSVLWNLRYRIPKTISVEHFAALGEFYANEQERKYGEERQATVARTALGAALLRAADRLVR